MVWLDEDLCNELMIIYWEVLDPATRWPALSQALREQSLSSFKIL